MNSANFPERKTRKRAEATARQEAYNKLSPAQKLERLDSMFGPGQGAQRERKRLGKQVGAILAAPAEPGQQPEVVGKGLVPAKGLNRKRKK